MTRKRFESLQKLSQPSIHANQAEPYQQTLGHTPSRPTTVCTKKKNRNPINSTRHQSYVRLWGSCLKSRGLVKGSPVPAAVLPRTSPALGTPLAEPHPPHPGTFPRVARSLPTAGRLPPAWRQLPPAEGVGERPQRSWERGIGGGGRGGFGGAATVGGALGVGGRKQSHKCNLSVCLGDAEFDKKNRRDVCCERKQNNLSSSLNRSLSNYATRCRIINC